MKTRKPKGLPVDQPPQKPNHPTRVTKSVAVSQSYYAGPIPQAEELIAYERAFPGCAEAIVQMAQRQSEHRQLIETRVVTANAENEKRGQWMAFVLGTLVLFSGVFLIWQGKSTQGVSILITEFLAYASIFIYGKHLQRKDLQRNKREIGIPEATRE